MSQDAEWKVLPHGPIAQLEENLWTVTGELAIPFNPLKRVMTIARRSDGKLVLHGLMALEESAQREIESLGEIAHLVVPSGFHRLDAARYRARYPGARLYAPKGGRARVEKKTKIDATYERYATDGATSLEGVDGLADREGALVVRSKRGVTYVMNDALFNMPAQGGLAGFVLAKVTQSSGGPRVSRTARIGIVADRARYRAALEAIAAVEGLVRVIVAHHVPIEGDVASAVRGAAATL
ncbi:MAG TPA: hypothetical protein VGH28_21240 [Polyangiaceae bacterium]|jgi:hypothetical protein